eukprot:NODE_591_length_5620_cov_0.949828.p3 type:complete len:179 gc:universal NODE_591_length_5620_cov_0.949828:1663-1127(-)
MRTRFSDDSLTSQQMAQMRTSSTPQQLQLVFGPHPLCTIANLSISSKRFHTDKFVEMQFVSIYRVNNNLKWKCLLCNLVYCCNLTQTNTVTCTNMTRHFKDADPLHRCVLSRIVFEGHASSIGRANFNYNKKWALSQAINFRPLSDSRNPYIQAILHPNIAPDSTTTRHYQCDIRDEI